MSEEDKMIVALREKFSVSCHNLPRGRSIYWFKKEYWYRSKKRYADLI